MIKLRLGEAAKNDLRDIRDYSKAQFGPIVAKEYMAGIDAVLVMLRERPGAGVPEEDIAPGLRGFAHRSHRIYYRATGDMLTIVRVLHHARDTRRGIGDQS